MALITQPSYQQTNSIRVPLSLTSAHSPLVQPVLVKSPMTALPGVPPFPMGTVWLGKKGDWAPPAVPRTQSRLGREWGWQERASLYASFCQRERSKTTTGGWYSQLTKLVDYVSVRSLLSQVSSAAYLHFLFVYTLPAAACLRAAYWLSHTSHFLFDHTH